MGASILSSSFSFKITDGTDTFFYFVCMNTSRCLFSPDKSMIGDIFLITAGCIFAGMPMLGIIMIPGVRIIVLVDRCFCLLLSNDRLFSNDRRSGCVAFFVSTTG